LEEYDLEISELKFSLDESERSNIDLENINAKLELKLKTASNNTKIEEKFSTLRDEYDELYLKCENIQLDLLEKDEIIEKQKKELEALKKFIQVKQKSEGSDTSRRASIIRPGGGSTTINRSMSIKVGSSIESSEKNNKNDSLLNEKINKSGFLLKEGSSFPKSWKKRWFILENEQLSYFNAKSDSKPLKTIDLIECDILPVVSNTNNKKTKNMLYQLAIKNKKGTLMISAETEEEKNDWINDLKKAVAKANIKGSDKKEETEL
jgi:hypothetical protein